MGEKEGIADLTSSLGTIAHGQADHGRAAELFEESLILCEELGDKRRFAQVSEDMAAVRAACGQPELATRLWTAEALREEIGAPQQDLERRRGR